MINNLSQLEQILMMLQAQMHLAGGAGAWSPVASKTPNASSAYPTSYDKAGPSRQLPRIEGPRSSASKAYMGMARKTPHIPLQPIGNSKLPNNIS